MVYIKLATPIRGFDKVRIKEVSFFDTNGEANLNKALGFKYQVYKKDGDQCIPFYERHISISDQNYINSAMMAPSSTMSAYGFICRQLLQYLINESLETGTIEID